MQRKQLRWNECSPIKEALNEGTSQWLKTSSMSEPTHKRMNDKTIELLNKGNKHRIAWKNDNVHGRKDKLSEQTRNKGITWNEMDMETNETKRNKMKWNGNEPENEKEHEWVN